MATLNYELGRPTRNGERRVSIILSHKGNRKRFHTDIILRKEDFSRAGKIASRKIQKAIDDRLKKYKDRLYDLNIDSLDREVGIDWIFNSIMRKTEDADFFMFTDSWLERAGIKSKKNYICMINALKKYTGLQALPFTSIDYHFLDGFKNYLHGHPRAQSLYLAEIRHMFNEAIKEYNYGHTKIIQDSPFRNFSIPKHVADTKDRVVSAEDLVKIFNFRGTRRVGMARDCYILSFCLIGMNSIDLYECTEYRNGTISYDRAKTKDRRRDHAHIEIDVPDIIKPLMMKYSDSKRVFDFYKRYSTASNFNKHINKGLEAVARKLDMPKFDFYSARHTWASIARNKLGIDKYTIHEALNHASDLDMTDIYIQKDYSNINKANRQVVAYIMNMLDKQSL